MSGSIYFIGLFTRRERVHSGQGWLERNRENRYSHSWLADSIAKKLY